MKKLIVLTILSGLIYSCKPTFNQAAQSKMKGNWTVSDVKIVGTNEWIKVTSFGDAEAKCFKGSQWFFVANNNTGNYTLTGGGNCPSGTTKMKWMVTPDNMFGFKKIFEGEKAKNVTEGYNLKLQNQTESSFQLVDEANVGGKQVQIIYQFTKS